MRVKLHRRGKEREGACARSPLIDEVAEQWHPGVMEERRFIAACGQHAHGIADRAVPPDPQFVLRDREIKLGIRELDEVPAAG